MGQTIAPNENFELNLISSANYTASGPLAGQSAGKVDEANGEEHNTTTQIGASASPHSDENVPTPLQEYGANTPGTSYACTCLLIDILDDLLQSDLVVTNTQETTLSGRLSSGQSLADLPSHEQPATPDTLRGQEDLDGLHFENTIEHIRHNASVGSEGEITGSRDSDFEQINEASTPISELTHPPSSTENDRTNTTNQPERQSQSASNTMNEDNGNNKTIHLHSRWGFEGHRFSNWRPWAAAAFSVAGFAWTVFYSYNATINPDPFLALVQDSSNTKIFLIAFSAQVTIQFLNWLIHEVYECLRWTWISSKRGTDLTSFLILSSSISPFGLIQFLSSRIYLRFSGLRKPCKGKYQPVTFFVCLRYCLLTYNLI